MLNTSTKCHASSLSVRSSKDSGRCQTRGRADGGGGPLMRGSTMALLGLLLCLLFVQTASKGCNFQMEPDTDQNVTIGSTLNIECSMKRKCINSSSISHKGRELHVETLHQTGRKRKIMVLLKVTSAEDQGTYYCKGRKDYDEKGFNIRVGYDLKNYTISNASFIFENQQNLLIYFNVTAPGPDDDMIRPEWKAVVKHETSCREHSIHELTRTMLCQQHLYDERFAERWVEITGRHIGETFSKNYSINPKELVKPSMVSGVEVEEGMRQVNVTWDARVGHPELHVAEVGYLTHSLTYQSQFDLEPLTIKKADCDAWKCRALLTNLVPHAQYNISISCKPNNKGYPSDPYILQIQTLTDAPDTGPGLPPWSFSWTNEGSQVTIYPTEVPAVHSGGDIKDYQVYLCGASEVGDQYRGVNSTCHSQVTPDMQLLVIAQASHSLTLRLPNLTTHGSVHLAVFATTSAGCSRNASHLYLPAPQTPRGGYQQWRGWVDAVQTNSNEFQIWFEPEDWGPEPEDTRLHWCCPYYSSDPTQFPACKEKLVTQKINSGRGVWNTTVIVNKCDVSPRFGISRTGHGMTSGIIWDSCLYDRHKGLDTVAKARADFEKDQTTIVVSWSMNCAYEARPQSYNLAFLDLESTRTPSSEYCDKVPLRTVSASHREMQWRETVGTGSSYAVCLRANAEKHGPWRVIPLSRIKNTNGTIIGSVLGSVIGIGIIVALAVATVCVVWFQFKKTDKVHIEYPELAPRSNSVQTLRELLDDDFKIKPESSIPEVEIEVPDEVTTLLVTEEEDQVNDSGCSEVSEPEDAYAFQFDDSKLEPVEEDSGRPSDSCDYAKAAAQNIT